MSENCASKASLEDLIERLQIEREIREYAQYLNKKSSTQVAEKMQQAYASLKQYHYSVFLAHRERHLGKPRTCINSDPEIEKSNKLLERGNGVKLLQKAPTKGLSNEQLEWLSLSFVPSFFGFFLTSSDVDCFFRFLQRVDGRHRWQMVRSLFYSYNFVQFVSQCFEPILNCAARPARRDGVIDAMVDSWNSCYDSACPKAVKRLLECDKERKKEVASLLTCFFQELFRNPQLFGIVPYCHDGDIHPLPVGKEWTDDDSSKFLERKSFDLSAYPLETDQWAPGTDEYAGCYTMMDSIDMNFLETGVARFMDRKLYYLSVERTADAARESDVPVWRELESAPPLPIFPSAWSVERVQEWIQDKFANNLMQDLGTHKMENATESGLVKKTLHARVCVENIAQEAEKIWQNTEMFRAALHVRRTPDAPRQSQSDKVLKRVASVLTGKYNSYKSFLASRAHLNTYDKALSYVLAKKDQEKLRIPENVCDCILQILSDDGDPITKFDAICKWVGQVKNLHLDAKHVLARTCAYSRRLLPLISNLAFLLRWLAVPDFVGDNDGDEPVFHLVQVSADMLGEVVGQFHIRKIMGTVTMRRCLLVGDREIIESLMRAVANNEYCPQVCKMTMFSNDGDRGDAVRNGGRLLVIYQYNEDVLNNVRFDFAIALVPPNGESRCSLPKLKGKIQYVYQPVPDASSKCAHGVQFVTKKEMDNPEIIGDVAKSFERNRLMWREKSHARKK